MGSWEDTFREWAKPPSKTEEDRCSNAESAIRNAIKSSDKLKNRDIKIFSQGSYRNNTNVRKNSDVDVGIICFDTFFHDFPSGYDRDSFGVIPATYHFKQFKDEVGEAINNYFGRGAVSRGNKAFDVHETSYHVEVDVAPFFEHRRYHENGTYLSGVELHADDGSRIINWPEQHYANGVQKNSESGRRYKAMVRVLKGIGIEMEQRQLANIPGFLAECLVWNVPNNLLGHPTYSDDLRDILIHLYERLGVSVSDEWGEVSELKYLFRQQQKWTKQQARDFIVSVWNYVGFS